MIRWPKKAVIIAVLQDLDENIVVILAASLGLILFLMGFLLLIR
jgi:hypothetical protein